MLKTLRKQIRKGKDIFEILFPNRRKAVRHVIVSSPRPISKIDMGLKFSQLQFKDGIIGHLCVGSINMKERIRDNIREEFGIEETMINPELKIVWAKKGRYPKQTKSFNLESLSDDKLVSFIENMLKEGWSLYSKNYEIRVIIMSIPPDLREFKKLQRK
ncbi:MAG: hypothetical protein ACFFCI_00670 [Promethearchaeota archaeon]